MKQICNHDSRSTTDTDNFSVFATGCETCSGETNGTGVIADNDEDGDGYCNLGSGISPEAVLGCDNENVCNDSYDQEATENDGSCLFFDDCGVCDGDSDCAIFIQDEIQITIDEALVSDEQAFSENFEDLLETQLGLTEGSVVVLSFTIVGNPRGDVEVIVDYTITLTEEELESSGFDSNSTLKKLKMKLIQISFLLKMVQYFQIYHLLKVVQIL